MSNENECALTDEFIEGAWIDGKQLKLWLNIKTPILKSWRNRGVIWYSKIGGTILYNKPWITATLKNSWTWGKMKKPPTS